MQQCTATCGEGTETREVMCLTFLRGQYRVGLDMQCSIRDKPQSTRPCNQGKCLSQWYMTDWSEVSSTRLSQTFNNVAVDSQYLNHSAEHCIFRRFTIEILEYYQVSINEVYDLEFPKSCSCFI